MTDYFFRNVAKILSQVDPLNLIDGGAPIDEYSNEAAQIAKFIKSDNKAQLKEYISLLLISRFNMPTNDNKLDLLICRLQEQTSNGQSVDN